MDAPSNDKPLPIAAPLVEQAVVPIAPAARRLDVGLLLAILALILLGVFFWVYWIQAGEIRRELGKRLSDSDQSQKQTALIAQETRADLREATAKLAVVEQKLAESQSQQVALQAMYQDIAKVSDDASVAEIEQILLIASQQLQLAGDVKAALAALQTVELRLQRLNRPRFVPLRRAVNQDIEKLRALPFVDVIGISVQLDSLLNEIDNLPLVAGRAERVSEKKPAAAPTDNIFRRIGAEMWGEVKSLLRIQNMEKNALPLLPPEQAYFVRENLKLRLLTARIALLQRQQSSYASDLQAAEYALERYFDSSARPARQALAALRELRRKRVNIDPPDISASLNAVRALSQLEAKTAP